MNGGGETFDPFSLLGLPRRYDLDHRDIETAHLRRVALHHPDRMVDSVRREEAQREVAALNEARDALVDDERRAEVLLTLLGGPRPESERALPEGYLMEIMDLQESLQDAAATGDDQARAQVDAEVAERRRRHRAEVAALFKEAMGQNRDALRRIRLELNAWRYVERLREALRG